jgi:hypothetical protein
VYNRKFFTPSKKNRTQFFRGASYPSKIRASSPCCPTDFLRFHFSRPHLPLVLDDEPIDPRLKTSSVGICNVSIITTAQTLISTLAAEMTECHNPLFEIRLRDTTVVSDAGLGCRRSVLSASLATTLPTVTVEDQQSCTDSGSVLQARRKTVLPRSTQFVVLMM